MIPLTRLKDTIHLPTCRHSRNALTWNWAKDKSREEVAMSVLNGLRFCKVCQPLEEIL